MHENFKIEAVAQALEKVAADSAATSYENDLRNRQREGVLSAGAARQFAANRVTGGRPAARSENNFRAMRTEYGGVTDVDGRNRIDAVRAARQPAAPSAVRATPPVNQSSSPMSTYMNPNNRATFQAPPGGDYHRAIPSTVNRTFSDNMRGGFNSSAERNSTLNAGAQHAQAAPAAAPATPPATSRPAQNVNMSRSFNPSPDDLRRRGNIDFVNARRDYGGLPGASSTTQAKPFTGPQASGMANHPVNQWAREQQARQPQPAAAQRPAVASRAPARMPSTLNFSQGEMNRAGLGADLMGPRRAAAVATRGLGGLPSGLPAGAQVSAAPAPAPQHGMAASGPPRPAARVPTSPSGIAIEDPFSSKPTVAQRPAPAPASPPRPVPAVAQNPAASGRRGRMQENRE